MTASHRQSERQYSKATLAKAAKILFAENDALRRGQRRLWLRRMAWAVGAAFLAGLAIGLLTARGLGA